MRRFLPYGKQSISEAEVDAVVECLRSDFLTCGPRVDAFEEAFAAHVGAKYAVAVSSATAALHLAMKVVDIGPGNRVVTSPNTFLASANCAAYVGATPDFSDIDQLSYNMDPAVLAAGWKDDTKAVVAVDYAGQSCDMPGIAKVARGRGAVVIEDASHATGGAFLYQGECWKIGGHPWADLTTFSFHPVKTMTTGEGGILVTDNPEYAARARLLRSHGMVREPGGFVGLGDEDNLSLSEKGSWYYEMSELGFNYRITDLQCALGLTQLERIDQFIARRREIVEQYNESFADCPFVVSPAVKPEDKKLTSWHLYTLQIDFGSIRKTRTQVMEELREQGVGTQVLYIPVHLQPYYRNHYGYGTGKCPNAENFYERALSIPLFPKLTTEDVESVVTAVLDLAS